MQVLQAAQGEAMSFDAASMQLLQLHMLQGAAKVVQVAGAAWMSCHIMSCLGCPGGDAAISKANKKTDQQQWLPIIFTSKPLHAHALAPLDVCMHRVAQVAKVIEGQASMTCAHACRWIHRNPTWHKLWLISSQSFSSLFNHVTCYTLVCIAPDCTQHLCLTAVNLQVAQL